MPLDGAAHFWLVVVSVGFDVSLLLFCLTSHGIPMLAARERCDGARSVRSDGKLHCFDACVLDHIAKKCPSLTMLELFGGALCRTDTDASYYSLNKTFAIRVVCCRRAHHTTHHEHYPQLPKLDASLLH